MIKQQIRVYTSNEKAPRKLYSPVDRGPSSNVFLGVALPRTWDCCSCAPWQCAGHCWQWHCALVVISR
eukprot:1763-Heterococcus_DN1.PRE.4